MQFKIKSGFLKIGALLTLLSAALYAAMVFDPDTQPPYSVAPYALKSGNLIAGATKAFRPWYENGAWQGDLIEYDIASDGTRTTDVSVGSNPASATGSNWMARATFDSKESSVVDYWKSGGSGRYIFTSTTGSNQVDFLWSNLTAAQKTALDATTAANGALDNDPYGSPILNYVRGNRSDEKSTPGGTLRIRYNLLGDIINSWPFYLGRPKEQYTIPGFAQFKSTHNSRAGRIFVGANDGMLHVFDEADGHEVYAYVPSMLLDKLYKLSATPYNHTYFVDGQLTAASAQTGTTWKSLVAGGLGAGGKGLYVLDVTSASASNNKVLFEKTGADFGHIYGSPAIGRQADGTWHVFTGNGYGSSNNVAKLLIISVDGSFNVTALSTGNTGGLSAPTLIDVTGNQKTDLVYAGDSAGDLWKFDLRPATPTVTRVYDGSADQPITSAPVVGPSPNGGFMIYFGTGSVTSLADATAGSYPTQAIYGIWDSTTATGSVIVEQTLVELADKTFTSGAQSNIETVRYVSDNDPVDYLCASQNSTCAKGWKVNLLNTGERVVGSPQLRAGRVTVITTNPQGVNGDTDLVGDSWLMSLDYLTGGDGDTVAFNLSGDAYLNNDDKVDIDGGGTLAPPVAVHLADGLISQPILARLGPGIDIMVINGIRLPLPQVYNAGPFLNGHIDVATDSPNDDLDNAAGGNYLGGSKAPNNVSKHSEDYNVRTSDGFGRGVDGHVHAYDTIHGVTYADLFQLEPRRNLGNLAALPVAASGGSCPAGSVGVYNTDTPPVLQGCVEKVEAELNRAYDTLTNPSTPVSEVNALNSTSALSATQKFIVVLANGDLSPAGVLQIGCRTWNVVEYENMITSQLESGVTPANLDDTVNGVTNAETLVFSLAEIASGASDSTDCSVLDEDAGLSNTPTLRIGFDRLAILNQGVHGTRSQCVLGLHDYRDKTCYSDEQLFSVAEAALAAGPDPAFSYNSCNGFSGSPLPPTDYVRDPARNLHITESLEGSNGRYRWRNGALTAQFLKVNNGTNAREFELQDPDDLPSSNQAGRFGGTYAKAFRIPNGSNKDPIADEAEESSTYDESGLLHEIMLYWHYSALVDGIRNADPTGNSTPQDTSCYGASNYSSALNKELGGLTNGEYQKLIADLGDEGDSNSLISQYSAALDALTSAQASGNENAINAALLALGALLAANSDLADYHKYRDYAPGHVPEQHLLDIDKDQDNDNNNSGGGSSDDGTPNQVDDLTGFGLSGDGSGGHLGNDVINGLRIWTDLMQ